MDRTPDRDKGHKSSGAPSRSGDQAKSQNQSQKQTRTPVVERESAARAFFTGGRFTSRDGSVQVGFLGVRVTAQNDKLAHRTEIKATGADGQRAAATLYDKHAGAGARLTRDERGAISGVTLPYSVANKERDAGNLASPGLQEGRQLTRTQAKEIEAPGRMTKSDISQAREQIRDFRPGELKAATRENYEGKLVLMASRDQRPEQAAGTNRSFHAYRAAARYGAQLEVKQGISERAAAYRQGDKPGVLVAESKIRQGLEMLNRYPKGGTLEENLKRADAITVRARVSENSNGKRDSLAERPKDWQDRTFENARERDKTPLAVMEATGLRPAELSKGVAVSRTETGAQFVVKGAKVDEQRGVPERTIHVSREALQATQSGQHLLQKLDERGHMFVKSEGMGDAFSERIHRAAERGGVDGVSCYDYRHQTASDAKAQGQDRETLAGTLGHRSGRSQSDYGRAAYGS